VLMLLSIVDSLTYCVIWWTSGGSGTGWYQHEGWLVLTILEAIAILLNVSPPI